MVRDLGDFGFADFEVGIEPLDNWAGLMEIETLTHDAGTDVAQLPSIEAVGGKLAQGGYQEFVA